jgi:hypothetical protein
MAMDRMSKCRERMDAQERPGEGHDCMDAGGRAMRGQLPGMRGIGGSTIHPLSYGGSADGGGDFKTVPQFPAVTACRFSPVAAR